MPPVRLLKFSMKGTQHLRPPPIVLGQAEEDLFQILCLGGQPDHTDTVFGQRAHQCRQCFVRQGGQFQHIRVLCLCHRPDALSVQHRNAFGNIQHPQQDPAAAVLLQGLQRALKQHLSVVQDAHLRDHLLDLTQ